MIQPDYILEANRPHTEFVLKVFRVDGVRFHTPLVRTGETREMQGNGTPAKESLYDKDALRGVFFYALIHSRENVSLALCPLSKPLRISIMGI